MNTHHAPRVQSTRPMRSAEMRLWRSGEALVCAAAVVLAGAGCSTAAPPAAPTTAAAELPPGGVSGVRVPTLDWTDAGDGYQEATALVPYDYAQPGGRTFSLHLVRLPATDPAHRIGSLFLNYGGPGDGAAETLRTSGAGLMPPEVLARYDLVGVDPRGTGQSQPVHCTGSPAEQQSLPYAMRLDFPTTPAEESVALDQVTRYAAECRARNGDLLDHIGTLAFARDLDVLRAALGDERINLLGLSYGTFLGQVVAATFPDRTGALVLDSVVDPAWVSDAPGTISTTRMNSDIGSWETLQQFFRLCAQAGPQGCAFAADGDPQERFAELAARLRTAPLQVPLPDRPPLALGYDNLVTISDVLLDQAVQWPALGQLLHAAMTGDAPAVAEVLEQVLPSATEYSTYFDAQAAIVCADTDNPRDPSRYGTIGRQRDATVAPYFGSRWASMARVCTNWEGRSTERYDGPWTTRTSTPVLLLNNRYDPATPYRNAVRVHDLLPNSALVTVDGVGHGAFWLSSCASTAMTQYLLTGVVPPTGTVCAQDLGPFDQPAQ